MKGSTEGRAAYKGVRTLTLRGLYAAAFGRVISGMEVVRTIQQQPDSGQMLVQPVLIHQIRRIRRVQ